MDRVAARKRLRGMMKDLKAQVAVTLDSYDFERGVVSSPLEFSAYADSGLDLFGGQGACQSFDCRMAYANRFARSFGLLADKSYLTDAITSKIESIGRPTNEALENLLDDVFVLKRLAPLVRAGVVRFRPASYPMCADCGEEFVTRVDEISEGIYKNSSSSIQALIENPEYLTITTGDLYDPPLFLRKYNKSGQWRHEDNDDAIRRVISAQVYDSLLSANSAAIAGGTVVSNSRLGMLGLLEAEKRLSSPEEFPAWGVNAAAQLPWVSELSVKEILILREEAGNALPRLREVMRRHLGAQSFDDLQVNRLASLREAMQELREDAAEVEAELKSIRSRKSRHFNKLYGILGLSIFAYGALDGKISEGLLGLAAALGLLHQFQRDDSKHAEALKSRPGYVLVQAREILAHSGQ